MAVKKGVGAELKLDVKDALDNIVKLSDKLKALKTDISKPLSVKLVVDTSELDKAAKKIKQTLGQNTTKTGGQTNSLGMPKVADLTQISRQLSTISKLLAQILSTTGNLNTQMHAFQDGVKESFAKQNEIRQFTSQVKQLNGEFKNATDFSKDMVQTWINAFATGNRLVAQFAEGVESVYGAYRNLGQNILTGFTSFASSVLETVGFGVTNMIDEAISQEKKLQQSQIGFANMFPGQDTAAMIQQVRTTAAKSPGLNSGDLADYINQLGAVSGGDFATAFNATMGILKTVQYGGGDAASQMGYIIKNIRDVMAKGKATQIDVQQFNRAMPLLQKSLTAIGASEFLKNGELTITKDNAKNLMAAFAELNTENNPAYNIFDQTAKTLGGLQEEFRETVSTQIATMLEGLGFFDALSELMRGSVFTEIDKGLEEFARWARDIKDAIDWGEVGKTATETLNTIKTAIGAFGRMIKENFGNTEFVKLAIDTVGSFFKGLIDGATELGKFLAHIKNTLGEEGFSNLARSLGQSVTQGLVLQKVLGGVSGLFGGIASLFQTFAFGRFLTQGFRSKGGGGATATGMKTLTAGISSSIGSVLARGLSGLGIAEMGKVAADVTENLHLFGDATTTVANVMQSLTYTIGGAVMGSFLGLPGAIATGVAGFIMSLDSMSQRINREEASATATAVEQIRKEGGEEFVQKIIDWYKDFEAMGAVFDEETKAAEYVKSQLAKYVNSNTEWDTAEAQKLFVQAYRQILLHQAGVGLDNEAGFWDLQGANVDWITRNEGGQPQLTEHGQRLAKVIRELNLVGYTDTDRLKNTVGESLVSEYLKNETLNEAQLKYLEERIKEIDAQVMPLTTDLFTEQEKKITQAGGDIVKAIENESDANWKKVLEDTNTISQHIQSIDQKIIQEAASDKIIEDSVARYLYGDELGKAVVDWQKGQQGFGGWLGSVFGNKDLEVIQSLLGTSNINQIVGKVFSERNRLELRASDRSLSEEERAAASKQLGIVNDYIQRITEVMTSQEGDWNALSHVLQDLTLSLAVEGNTAIVPEFKNNLDELVKQLRRNLGLDENGQEKEKTWWDRLVEGILGGGQGIVRPPLTYRAGGGFVKPIFRAGGGGVGVDTVPAFLQPGEFVQRASAVSTAGLGVMNALNNGDLASAYRMIGSKINGSWDNSRNVTSNSDNRRNVYAPTFNIFGRRSSRASYDQALRV